MGECPFCQIANKKLPSRVKFENQDYIAFEDINPKALTHILIIPKKHYGSVASLSVTDAAMVGNLVLLAQGIARDLGIDKSGYRLVFNSGNDAGTEVDHLHMHLLGGSRLNEIN